MNEKKLLVINIMGKKICIKNVFVEIFFVEIFFVVE